MSTAPSRSKPSANLHAAFAAHREGRLLEAERIYEAVLAAEPDHHEVRHHLGMLRHLQGRSDEGLEHIRQAIAAQPAELRYRFNLAAILARLDRAAEAEGAYRDAARNAEGTPAEWLATARAELAGGQPTEAMHRVRMAVLVGSEGAEPWNLLGECYRAQRRYAEARQAFAKALESEPRHVPALCGLGRSLLREGRREEGLAQLEAGTAIEPLHPDTNVALAEQSFLMGQYSQVVERLEPVVAACPEHAEARYRLATGLVRLRRLADAETHLRHAVAANPNDARYHCDLSGVLIEAGKHDEGVAEAHAALRLDPELAEPYAYLGAHAVGIRRFDEAAGFYLQGLVRAPQNGDIRTNYGNVLLRQNRVEEAWAEYREVLSRDPRHTQAHSNLLLTLNYRDPPSLAWLLEEHCSYWRQHGASIERPARYANDPQPDRPLRIGFVAGHITTTPVHVFMRPFFEHYDRGAFQVHVYDIDAPDARVQQLKAMVDGWHDIEGQTLAVTAEQIREDRIDILVDLMGHMGQTRILLFAHKPAPVQASYMGYLNTTGFETIDWFLTDALQNPPETQAYFSERLYCLPRCFVCYAPAPDAPAPAPPPLLERGRITFGCYNNLAKLSPRAVRVFARVVRAVPGATLALKSLHSNVASAQARLREQFAAQGVAPERIEFSPPQAHGAYLADFAQIDVALDPFPYNGNTSTNDALYMGVPVVALAGDNAISRTGASLLTHLGRPEWVAPDEDAYVEIARRLVADPQRLAAIRAGLRAEMEASPLMDGAGFAQAMEAALRDLWCRWCRDAH